MVITLLIAVILTESAKSPLAKRVTKLEEVSPWTSREQNHPYRYKIRRFKKIH